MQPTDMGPTKLFILALLGSVLAYYLYNPLPKDIEQPLLYCTFTAAFKIIEDIGKISEMLGYKEVLVFRREALAWRASLFPDHTGTDIKITNEKFDGVPVRIYQPSTGRDGTGLSPAFVYVHGGGYTTGNVYNADAQMSHIVRETGVTVVSIEYRLAPEHPTPSALDDCEVATRYFFKNAGVWGVDARRIGIGGDSAGGNMAAVLSLKYRDMGGKPQFSYQLLIYPWVQGLDFNLPSYKENEAYNRPDMQQHGMVLYTLAFLGIDRVAASKVKHNQHITKATRAKYQHIMNIENIGYKNKPVSDSEVDEQLAAQLEPLVTNPYNFPLMAESVKDVPPAMVITAGLDPLLDEGLLYLDRLRKADVKTEHYNDVLCWHGSFILSTKFECGARMVKSVSEYIGRAKDYVAN